MSRAPLAPLETVVGDSLIGPDSAAFSPTRHSSSNDATSSTISMDSTSPLIPADESDESTPLLTTESKKKPFYRPRPLWLVPFAITASLVRGMTLAPRVEVYTQLSCNALHGDHHWNHTQTQATSLSTLSLYASLDPLGPHLHTSSSPLFLSPVTFTSNLTLTPLPPSSSREEEERDRKDSDDTDDPRRIPSARCQGDTAVQAGAARLQTMMTTIMGLLSALTTGWWGHFGERHGRTRVLAIATFGLFLTDLTFILVSTPGSPLSRHGHKFLLVAPIIEGFLGGWSTLQSAVSAYLSDCTSPGSRAQIFSRFQGVLYVGFAVGPSIGGWLIQHPIRVINGTTRSGEKTVTLVFWVAIVCSFLNFLLVLFVFPESLNKKKMLESQAKAETATAKAGVGKGKRKVVDQGTLIVASGSGANPSTESSANVSSGGIFISFLRPLSVFLPATIVEPSPNNIGLRKRRDWSLTILATALFGLMLSTGLFQLKYLYAVHTYGWSAEQLGYYISFMGAARAVWLLFLLPSLIAFFKPKPKVTPIKTATTAESEPQGAVVPVKKPKPTREQLGREIKFDLALTRCSLLMDMLSHSLVAIVPVPPTSSITTAIEGGQVTFGQSQAMFVFASSLNGMGSGAVPAMHSLALCMMQVRALGQQEYEQKGETTTTNKADEGTGQLFGALAVLQAVGQMILGPMLFGLIYSETVAKFPKAIFVVGAGIVLCALAMMMCVRNPVRLSRYSSSLSDAEGGSGIGKGVSDGKKRRGERGRSRMSKDLRGGAIGPYIYSDYGSCGSAGTTGSAMTSKTTTTGTGRE